MITSAFTCTGSYAILIMLGIKRVENRSMCPSPMKGRCAVSCSKSFCKEEFGNFIQWASQVLPADQFAQIPAWKDVADWPGKIVGCVDYSCHEGGDDGLWDEGYVKGLGRKGLIQSCFWHRFALTVHSPIAKEPEKFGIVVERPRKSARVFARNELAFGIVRRSSRPL